MQLEIRNIHKSFGAKHVLRGITLAADGGKAFGLLGRNGAGKTTTIRILMDVFGADEGEVLLDGAPLPYESTSFGYLPEERGLYPKKKIVDQLVYFARLKGMEKSAAVAAVDHWLPKLELAEYRDKRLDTLSKGNQQKIQLITALAHDPQIIVLDEPFSGLDPVNAQLLKDVVKEEIGRGKIVFFSSHQMNYIEEFCDRIAILNNGEVAISGELSEIKRSYPRNRLIVRSPQAEEIRAAFGPACTKGEQDELIVQLDTPEDKAAVMRRLTESWNIDEVRVKEPTLADIFIEYAGDDPMGTWAGIQRPKETGKKGRGLFGRGWRK